MHHPRKKPRRLLLPPQVWVLSGRMLRMWWRNPAMLFAELTQYLFMGLFVGLGERGPLFPASRAGLAPRRAGGRRQLLG